MCFKCSKCLSIWDLHLSKSFFCSVHMLCVHHRLSYQFSATSFWLVHAITYGKNLHQLKWYIICKYKQKYLETYPINNRSIQHLSKSTPPPKKKKKGVSCQIYCQPSQDTWPQRTTRKPSVTLILPMILWFFWGGAWGKHWLLGASAPGWDRLRI